MKHLDRGDVFKIRFNTSQLVSDLGVFCSAKQWSSHGDSKRSLHDKSPAACSARLPSGFSIEPVSVEKMAHVACMRAQPPMHLSLQQQSTMYHPAEHAWRACQGQVARYHGCLSFTVN